MTNNIFWVNEKSRLLKNIKAGRYRVFIGPLVDFALMLIILAILGMNKPKLYLEISTSLTIILLGFAYMIYSFIRGLKEMHIYKVIHNLAIVKNANNFILVRPHEDNSVEYMKDNIEKIITEKNILGYDIFEFKNCKLLKETKNYFDFEGYDKNGLTKFKIYKIYVDNESLRVDNNA